MQPANSMGFWVDAAGQLNSMLHGFYVGELDARLAKYLKKVKVGGSGNTTKVSMLLSTAQSMPGEVKLCTNSLGFALVRITLSV
jgi:hypothetical protein